VNILGLIFALILILSYGFYASWEKQNASTHLRSTYVGHQKANRKILNRYQSLVYSKFNGKSGQEAVESDSSLESNDPKQPKPIELNRSCAKINLWPLIQEGRESHPLLYELTAKMIRTFYSALQPPQEKRFEYHFLDQLLSSVKLALQEEPTFALEKTSFTEAHLQRLFYKMLKGTKKWDLLTHTGYPSLLDYVKVEPSQEKVCLFHAHSDMLIVLFGEKIGSALHTLAHQKEAPPITPELVQRISSELHQISIDPDLFNLVQIGRPIHEEAKKTFIAEDETSNVSLRKNVYFNG
jgi:hypothetical protein